MKIFAVQISNGLDYDDYDYKTLIIAAETEDKVKEVFKQQADSYTVREYAIDLITKLPLMTRERKACIID